MRVFLEAYYGQHPDERPMLPIPLTKCRTEVPQDESMSDKDGHQLVVGILGRRKKVRTEPDDTRTVATDHGQAKIDKVSPALQLFGALIVTSPEGRATALRMIHHTVDDPLVCG